MKALELDVRGNRRGAVLAAAAIFVLAVILRWVAVSEVKTTLLASDAPGYHYLALSLLRGDGLTWPDGKLMAHRPPGYPLFLAMIYSLTGPGNYQAVVYVQAVISSLLCVLIYALAYIVLDRRSAVIAGMLAAISPELIVYSGAALSEILSMAVFAASLFMMISAKNSRVQVWGGGVLLGVGTLIRPAVILFLPGIAIWLLWSKQGELRHRMLHLTGFLVAVLLTMSPWIVRNYVRFHAFIPLTSHGGTNLWAANKPGSWGGIRGEKPGDPIAQLDGDTLAKNREGYKLALQAIRENPGWYVKLSLLRLSNLWTPFPDPNLAVFGGVKSQETLERYMEYKRRHDAGIRDGPFEVDAPFYAEAWAGVFFSTVSLLCCFGFAWALIERKHAVWLFILCAVSYAMFIALTMQQVRYRAMLVPLLILGASYGVAHPARYWWLLRRDKTARLITAIGCVGVALVISNIAYHLLGLDLPFIGVK